MKTLLAAIGVLLVLGGSYYLMQNPGLIRDGEDYTRYEINKFSFNLPADWIATSTATDTSFNRYSSDFAVYVSPCDPRAYECYPESWITRGTTFRIYSEPVDNSIASPEKFLLFKERGFRDCTNCSRYERIVLDGIPADINYVEGIKGEPQEGAIIGVSITFFYDGEAHSFSFYFALYTTREKEIVSEFVKSFRIAR